MGINPLLPSLFNSHNVITIVQTKQKLLWSVEKCVERGEGGKQSRVVRSKKLKRPNFAISSFKIGQILKNKRKPNKGQIFFENLL